MSEKPISPLRQRMIEDMTVRNFVEKTRNDYIRHFKTMMLWHLVQENKTAIIRARVQRFDPSRGILQEPIFTDEGEFSYDRFAQYLIVLGVAWPRLPSGSLDLDKDAFRLMSRIPGIDGIYALRKSLRLIQTADLPIGPDGINRPSLFPFGTLTGRNAHGRSLFNCHAAMRSLIQFSPHKVGLYSDYRTQEVGIMIQALATDRSDQPLGKSVLPR